MVPNILVGTQIEWNIDEIDCVCMCESHKSPENVQLTIICG